MKETYLNVPSIGAIDRDEAIEIALRRWNIELINGELYSNGLDSVGICYQGDYGNTYYIRFKNKEYSR